MFCNVLKRLRNQHGFTQQELAKHLKISGSAVAMYESGKRMPDYDLMLEIANFFNVDLNFLYEKKIKSAVKIPILGYVAAGIPIEAITDIIDYEEINSDMLRGDAEYFGLEIKGDSMEPVISNGDYVIVKKQPTCDSGQIAIVCVNGDNATCKKIIRQESGIMLLPFNPQYETVFYSNEQIEQIPITIFGVVVEQRRKFVKV